MWSQYANTRVIGNDHKIIRLLTAGEIPHAKQINCKEIWEAWGEKNTPESVIESDKPRRTENSAGHQDAKQTPGYQTRVYQPQWFIECFNNTSVHQLIHSQKWQVPKKFTSTLSKSKYILFCSIQQSSVWGQKASDKQSLSNAQWFWLKLLYKNLVPSSMHPPIKTSVQKT